jgi:hypothetical protein
MLNEKENTKVEKKPAMEKNEPNIAFIGEGDPLLRITTPTGSVDLPEKQDKPFYHEQAADVIRVFPHLYKHVTKKGDK